MRTSRNHQETEQTKPSHARKVNSTASEEKAGRFTLGEGRTRAPWLAGWLAADAIGGFGTGRDQEGEGVGDLLCRLVWVLALLLLPAGSGLAHEDGLIGYGPRRAWT